MHCLLRGEVYLCSLKTGLKTESLNIKMKKVFKKFFKGEKISAANTNEIFIWPHNPDNHTKEKIRFLNGHAVISNIHQPSIIPYMPDPETATGTAVIIAPGGGHSELWINHEGHNVARWFCKHGIASFILKYRLAKEPGSAYKIHEHTLADMQQAIRFVRSNAKEWKINKSRIGVMGFSAGGELAALAAMHFDNGNNNADDEILKQSSYPNFQALIYPAGINNFRAVKNSPPLFLLGGFKDDAEISKGMAEMYLMYKSAGIPAELHIYANEGHGFGVLDNNSAAIADWPARFRDWLSASGFM